jgi:DNA-binding MarR family transcriptional regulator
MRIDSNTIIAGQPAKVIRDFLYQVKDHSWSTQSISEKLGVSRRKAQQIVRDLEAAGYIQREEMWQGQRWFRTTLNGNQLALASAALPLKRVTAMKKLEEFLTRVQTVNHDPYYLYRVERAVLFGSMLSGQDTVGDIDVAIELRPKRANREEHAAVEEARIAEAGQAGRRFQNIIDKLFWPQHEIRLYLKSRSRAISLHDIDDPILLQCESRTIYEYKSVGRAV